MNPLLRALRDLGGSGSVEEIYEKVVELEKIPEELLLQLHDPERSNQTEVAYRLAWSRTYLKKLGYVENSSRGVWSLTTKARESGDVNPLEVVRAVRAMDKELTPRKAKQQSPTPDEHPVDVVIDGEAWKEKLHKILTSEIEPSAFERLAQRLLRESGFVSVEVTGRSNDGGIDGKGIARIHGLMSFHVIFQCKRYQGSISAGAIRDFRGAMVGRADKGLFITTGTFSPSAVKEATRDGAPPIDLVDGNELAEKLKELSLGIEHQMVETITVNEEWFKNL